MENLESGSLSYIIVEDFLSDLKEEFGRRDNETMKVAELKKVEQKSRMMKKFVQEFRRAVRGSRYERRPLIKEFKRKINKMISVMILDPYGWIKEQLLYQRNTRELNKELFTKQSTLYTPTDGLCQVLYILS